MKNHLLLLLLALLPFIVSAQATRRVLVEEATNASCGPCAAQNPAFDALLQQNSSIVAVIKYHSSWPGYDPMYLHNTDENNARIGYYGINSVPRAVVGGIFNGSPSQVTQTMLNSYASNPSPFEEIEIYHYLSPGEDSIYTFMRIRAAQNFSESSLRGMCVVVEKTINFATPPGTNGEKEFHDVMKKMLPTASGTPLKSNWLDGDYQIIAQSWKLANVYNNQQLGIVGFVQNINSKIVHQSGVSTNQPFAPLYSNDVALTSVSGITSRHCTGKISPEITFVNYGANDITSVDIYYSVNNEPMQMTTWTGEVSYLKTKKIVLPEILFDVQDENELKVYFSNTNGQGDDYPANDTLWFNFDRATQVMDNVTIMIKLDNNPEETTWDVKNSDGEIVFEGGPYTVPNGFVSVTMDFEESDCYEFSIYDAGGNGLTLPGFFNLYKGTEQIISGSAFGSKATQQFSVEVAVGVADLSFDPQLNIYPNPMTNSGIITFVLPHEAPVEINMLNQLGQKIKQITNQTFYAGDHTIPMITGDLPQGIYFLEIMTGGEFQVKKVSVLKY